jgi:ComF family protein
VRAAAIRAGEARAVTIGPMAILRGLAAAASAALDLCFPAVCSGCGHEGEPLCEACLPALDARLGLPGGTPIGLAADIPEPLLQLEWCAPFSGPVRGALHELKYAGERRLARPLGQAIARRWRRVGEGPTVVVPVPVHAERERHRGYDQAALIASVAAEDLGLPCVRALERGRATIAQFELGRDDRAANVAGAFRLPNQSRAAAAAISGRWILLVDDVVTTGATLAACATALEAAGALGVSAIAVARER